MPRTISDNLIRLEQAKTDIGTAINSYGFDTPSNSTLTTYPTTINTIGTDINGTLETCLGTGSGHSIVINKTITTNGVYSPLDDNAYAYDEVTVNVANSYEESDEGKVVIGGALVSQTDYGIVTENGTYNTTENNSITVDVPSNADVIPLTTTFSDIERIEAYIVKTSTNIYIYGLMHVNNVSGQYVTDIVFNYDSNIDVSGLNGKNYYFNGLNNNSYYGTLIVNQNNKTITYNDPSYFMLQTGTYAIHPSSFSSN